MGKSLEDMEARAKRQLDGMTVNRDEMAKDVLSLVAAVRAASAELARQNKPKSWIDELFGDVFKGG